MSGIFELSVHVLEGKNFPRAEAFRILASFCEDFRTTTLCEPSGSPSWAQKLEWRVEKAQLLRVMSTGLSQVKLTVLRHDEDRLGWVVLELRTAKLNATQETYLTGPGEWAAVAGAGGRVPKGGAPPLLRLRYVLREVPLPPSPSAQQRVATLLRPAKEINPEPSQDPEHMAVSQGPEPQTPQMSAQADAAAPSAADSEPQSLSEPTPDPDPSPVRKLPTPTEPSQDDTVAAVAAAAALEVALHRVPPPPPLRAFRLCVDVRGFRATRKMPLAIASVYVKLRLPAELEEVIVAEGGKPPLAFVTPHRTHPPVEVAKGSEVVLQNGFCEIQFASSVIALATALTTGPRIFAEVWHRDKYTSDQQMGVASVGIAPLLKEPYLDGSAPVQALVKSTHSAEKQRVTVGSLRLVVTLEEFGETSAQGTRLAAAVNEPAPPTAASSHQEGVAVQIQETVVDTPQEDTEDVVSQAVSAIAPCDIPSSSNQDDEDTPSHAPSAPSQPLPPISDLEDPAAIEIPQAAAQALSEAELRNQPEYKVALELEAWKQAEVARWRAGMRAREMERMSRLEGEWRRREKMRDTEHKKLVEEALEVEVRLKQLLLDTEDRERKLTAAEEAVCLKRESMERDLGNRMTEAQQAVRRLQEHCDHQLEMERSRTREAERRCQALEERAAVAESRAERLDHALEKTRAEHRSTPEALLQQELAAAVHQKHVAEQQLAEAVNAKQKYKDQIRQLARQLAITQKQKMEIEMRAQKEHDLQRASHAAETQMSRLKAERKELWQLTQQLANMGPAWRPQARDDPPGARSSPHPAGGEQAAGHTSYDCAGAEVHSQLSHGDCARQSQVPEPYEPPQNAASHTKAAPNQGPRTKDVDIQASPSPPKTSEAVPLDVSSSDEDEAEMPVHADMHVEVKATNMSVSQALPNSNADQHRQEPVIPRLKAVSQSKDSLRHPKSGIDEVQTSVSREATAVHPSHCPGETSAGSVHMWPESRVNQTPPTPKDTKTRHEEAMEVRRLLKERADLMATGVYTKEDRLIRDLDKCIAELQASASRAS